MKIDEIISTVWNAVNHKCEGIEGNVTVVGNDVATLKNDVAAVESECNTIKSSYLPLTGGTLTGPVVGTNFTGILIKGDASFHPEYSGSQLRLWVRKTSGNSNVYCIYRPDGDSFLRWHEYDSDGNYVDYHTIMDYGQNVLKMTDPSGISQSVLTLYDDAGTGWGSNLIVHSAGNTIIGGGKQVSISRVYSSMEVPKSLMKHILGQAEKISTSARTVISILKQTVIQSQTASWLRYLQMAPSLLIKSSERFIIRGELV